MTEQNKQYRDKWHVEVLSIIERRLTQYEKLKISPGVYNMAIKTEIFKFVHEELIEEVPRGVVDEFNLHLLSFHEEMEILSEIALEKFCIRI